MFSSLRNRFKQFLTRVREALTDTGHRLCSLLKIGPESSSRIRRRQFLWGGSLAFGISALVYGMVLVLLNPGPATKKREEIPHVVETNIATATKHINMDEARWSALDGDVKKLTKEVFAVKRVVNGESPINDGATVDIPVGKINLNPSEEQKSVHNVPHPATTANDTRYSQINDPRLQEILERIASLESERETLKNEAHTRFQNPYASHPVNGSEREERIIQKLSLNLSSPGKSLKTVETTIPAGAFAKTVLLSGLDASSAMNASSDPRPMLLRMIDHGTLPRQFQSDLKDCHCTAGAYGDLSSERVYARLEKLTCVNRKTGEIVETQVSGYVAGSDGKAGIRGIVASKDGQFLARSLMGGMFAGLSNVANPQNRRAQVNPFFGGGAASPEVSGPSIGENFLGGMANGATTALDRLSQYYIDRAEQLQPVIQIAAGQVVDIVFTEGTFIGSQERAQKSGSSSQTQNNPSHPLERH